MASEAWLGGIARVLLTAEKGSPTDAPPPAPPVPLLGAELPFVLSAGAGLLNGVLPVWDGIGSSKLVTYWSRLLMNAAVKGLSGATGYR